MQLAICTYYAASLMSEPNHKSELETQILFGDVVSILESKGNWSLVQAAWDAYEGWMLTQQLQCIAQQPSNTELVLLMNASINNSSLNADVMLPWAANIPASNNFKLGETAFAHAFSLPLPNTQTIAERCKLFLGVPYLWGGRTHAGIDCSGFSAIIYKSLGIALKHDASWQMQQGEVVDFLQNTHPGDLAFFDNAEGQITHVGILLNENTIIHATETAGGVTIDDIDNHGIISRTVGKRTHNLRIIKRLL